MNNMVERGSSKESVTEIELMDSVYQLARHNFHHDQIVFNEHPPSSIIADDSDHHRIRRGLMLYDNTSVLSINGKEWLLALGTRTRNYPAKPYSFDFKAFPLVNIDHNKKLHKEVKDKLFYRRFFKDSLLIGISGRGIVFNDRYPLSAKLADILKPSFKDFVTQTPEINHEFVNHPGLGPPVLKKVIRYDRAFAQSISDATTELIQNHSK